MKTITKYIIEVWNVTWIQRNFYEMDDAYRKNRKALENPMRNCGYCGKEIQNGEQMTLIGRKGMTNTIVCTICANLIESQPDNENKNNEITG